MTDPYYVEMAPEAAAPLTDTSVPGTSVPGMEVPPRPSHDGIPLVLLHGFCETHQVWAHYLSPLGKKYRVLCPDLPGFGKSSSLPAGFSLSDVADRLAGWLEQLGIGKAVLVGHSLGGYVALAMLERHPSLVAGIGLFNSTAYADSAEKKRSRTHVIDFVEKHGVETFATSFVPQLFHPTNRPYLQGRIQQVVADAATTPEYTLIGYTRAMQQRPNRLRVLEAFSGPILYVIGEHDSAVPLEDSKQQLLQLADYQAYILEETGHMGMFEQEERCLEILEEFMQKVVQLPGNSMPTSPR
ncbi:alpha/beta fold hydrolase [Cesiribacter andamanensis]|uniref:Dihydrolipoyllysine-residue acetyltransferase component of acetoin cleaving system n=1 Tax=Cesiribacter andamanensis AMV16 TaxID=1279009 RepID=M7N502_9BACT|nr:alpha/beta hydrolase [Cesiribacter andamanensis]EMR02281.1 Dihydrolipoyllysine-residue acetyltransferase component of acetoin cleaving system [Cesiribacter andamanensis AMV16]